MTHISAADAPVFNIPGVTFTGLASPSRGASENATWRVVVHAGTQPTRHRLTREEIFVATSGKAVAEVGEKTFELRAGDTLVVPAFTDFSLANPSDEEFEAVVVLPIGGRVLMADGTIFIPPWCA